MSYLIKLDILNNHQEYGFRKKRSTFMADYAAHLNGTDPSRFFIPRTSPHEIINIVSKLYKQ